MTQLFLHSRDGKYTALATITAVAVMLLLAAGAAGARENLADQDIGNAVDDQLINDPAVPAWNIDVSTKEGIVTLTGTVTNILVLDANEESYLVQIELVSGEWIGLDEVRSYSCRVVFSGPRFAKVFPARVPRNPPPEAIKANDTILIVASLLQTVEIGEGETAWVLEGIYARRLR